MGGILRVFLSCSFVVWALGFFSFFNAGVKFDDLMVPSGPKAKCSLHLTIFMELSKPFLPGLWGRRFLIGKNFIEQKSVCQQKYLLLAVDCFGEEERFARVSI